MLIRRSCGNLPLSHTRLHCPRHEPVGVRLAVLIECHAQWRDGTIGDRVDRVAFRRSLPRTAGRVFPTRRTSRLGIPRPTRESSSLLAKRS